MTRCPRCGAAPYWRVLRLVAWFLFALAAWVALLVGRA
jgi:hypothetical protein